MLCSSLALGAAAALGADHQPTLVLQPTAAELFAVASAGAGDVDGDGVPDLVVFATDANGVGMARVYSGADGAALYAFGPVETSSWYKGTPVAAAGDANGDGFADVLVGNEEAGRAELYSGRDGALLHALSPGFTELGERFGGTVAGAGDVNGDGFDDAVVGTTWPGAERAVVFSGLDGSVLHTLRAPSGTEDFGAAVASAGDLDGDGRADLLVGAASGGQFRLNPGFPPLVPPFKEIDRAGAVRAFAGLDGAPLFSAFGDDESDALGYSVAPAGDVNGDGVPDLVAGARGTDNATMTGYARVWSGADGAVLHTFLAGSPNHPTWLSVAGPGDLDQDGFDDVLVGSVGSGPGYVHVRGFSGLTGAEIFQYTAAPVVQAIQVHVSAVGDTNADGVADFLVGVPEPALGLGHAILFESQ